jgi:hypothetical protein
MSISRFVPAIGSIIMLNLWIFVAISFEFPPPTISQGWNAVPQGFLFGFMLIPEAIVNTVIWGISGLI